MTGLFKTNSSIFMPLIFLLLLFFLIYTSLQTTVLFTVSVYSQVFRYSTWDGFVSNFFPSRTQHIRSKSLSHTQTIAHNTQHRRLTTGYAKKNQHSVRIFFVCLFFSPFLSLFPVVSFFFFFFFVVMQDRFHCKLKLFEKFKKKTKKKTRLVYIVPLKKNNKKNQTPPTGAC